MFEQLVQPLSLIFIAIIVINIAVIWYLIRRLKQHKLEPFSAKDNLPLQLYPSESEPANSERFVGKADEAMRLTQTFRKFVPKQFVDHFAKHGSSELELGRAVGDDVSIMFCDIRGFTGLSEQMSPQELMKFLNSYFLRMNGAIHENGGFIDKFIGDAIMALFDSPNGDNCDKARDALKAAIDLRHALSFYNLHRAKSGYAAINIGIGIHFGPVIIGTVGSDDRMDTTVIGDSVNIAYRLETLAPKLNSDIVVSAQVLETAKAHGVFCYRTLDWVRVKGRKQPIKIYEILDHLPYKQQQEKLAVAELIEQGLALRIKQKWVQALYLFEQALAINPKDKLILHHVEQCHRAQGANVEKDWDGSLSLI